MTLNYITSVQMKATQLLFHGVCFCCATILLSQPSAQLDVICNIKNLHTELLINKL